MSLTFDQLGVLEYYRNAHDRIGYYETLASYGVPYGDLALSVVTAEQLAGSTANIFLQGYAGLSNDQLVGLSIDLMEADFSARQTSGDLGREGNSGLS
jgi:hypothetical protein